MFFCSGFVGAAGVQARYPKRQTKDPMTIMPYRIVFRTSGARVLRRLEGLGFRVGFLD